MPHLSSALVDSLIGLPGFDKQAFIHVHESGEQITSIRINPNKTTDDGQQTTDTNTKILSSVDYQLLTSIPWCATGYYLPKRPSFTLDPLFHAGAYYVQEASSMFLEQALQQTVDLSQPLKVLDL